MEASTQRGGLALCLAPEFIYEEANLTLQFGDRLMLFTDDVTEAADAEGTGYGEDRLMDRLQDLEVEPTSATVTRLLNGLTTFTEGRKPTDDVTNLALQRTHD